MPSLSNSPWIRGALAAETGEHYKAMPVETVMVEATTMKAAAVNDGEVTSLKSAALRAAPAKGGEATSLKSTTRKASSTEGGNTASVKPR